MPAGWAGDSSTHSGAEANCGHAVKPARISDAKTLRKHYRDELDTGQIKATAKVAEFLFRKATEGGFAAVVIADEFLGIGERQFAIPFDNLALAKDALVVIDLSAEALAQSPEWDQSLATRDLAPEDTTQMRVWEMPEGEGSQ